MRPLIGISTYREQARWGFWDVPAVLLPASYADAVARPVASRCCCRPASVTADVVARLDGLVLAGGADVDPARYGEEPGPHTTATRPDRDASEVAVLQAALDRDLPLLAICRGMQLLNVAARRHPPAAPARRPGDRAPPARTRAVRGAEGPHGPGQPARRRPRADRDGELPSPPGAGPDRARPHAVGLGGGRRRRGRSRPPAAASASPSSGIPRRARTAACSRRWWTRPDHERIDPRRRPLSEDHVRPYGPAPDRRPVRRRQPKVGRA